MKHSAAKTLGVAFAGAAFAAAAAGSASAATAPATPEVAGALDSVARTLPLEKVTSELPAGTDRSVDAGRTALGSTVSRTLPGRHVTAEPVTGLLGGLPANGLPASGLPTDTLPGNALSGNALPGFGG